MFLHSPPDSNNAPKSDESDSELSDLEEDQFLDGAPKPVELEQPAAEPQPTSIPDPPVQDDIGEVLPDHWSDGVPVFKPTMDQFKDFKRFVCFL